MFPCSAFSAVPTQIGDQRGNGSDMASPISERARLGIHPILPEEPQNLVGQYPHLVAPVACPPG